MAKKKNERKLSIPEQYIEGVLSGEIVVGRLRRRCVERHVYDLETGAARGLHFDPEAGFRIIDFFQFLHHSKGEWAGEIIHLEPWQQFDFYVLFGWMKGKHRRFRTALDFEARKNGKSTRGSGVGNYLFIGDREPGAEVYSVATKREQAKIVHSEAKRMVEASPHLKKIVSIYKDNLNIKGTASKFEPLASEEDSLDGLNVHGVVIDELHAHKNRQLFDLMDTATGSRRQPLIYIITTAGFNKTGIAMEMYDYGRRILEGFDVEGGTVDDSYFVSIHQMDEGDDPWDEKNWIKANPNLGVSVKFEDLRRKAHHAKENPAAQNSFLCKHLNMWTSQEVRFVPMDKWDLCAGEVDAVGECYGGLDLARRDDLVAWVLVFPKDDGTYHIRPKFFIPKEGMRDKGTLHRVDYEAWEKAGFLIATPGETVDYNYIFKQIDDDAKKFDIREVAFDRYGSESVISRIDDAGVKVVEFGQGYVSMSTPTKELVNLVKEQKIVHGGHPILRWNADNVIVETDPAGNIKPSKKKSTQKIDGIVAMIMGLDRALRNGGKTSVYEERELLVI